MAFDLSRLLDLIPALRLAAMFGGDAAREGAEKAFTIPEARVRAACKGMTEPDVQIAIAKLRQAADDLSDALALIASRGAVRPD